MTTSLYFHSSFLDHDTGPRHPESPARLTSLMKALDEPVFSGLDRREPAVATRAQLELVHSPTHIERVFSSIPLSGRQHIDVDTVVSSGSREASLRAAGAVVAAVDTVCRGITVNAFCPVRPPGHHAEPNRAMGFCLFNNVAIGAAYANSVAGIKRVAIVDIDVHHGNGTQAWVANQTGLLYASIHQLPLYPGTGEAADRGSGNVVNVPLPPGASSGDFRHVFSNILDPALRSFEPELIMVSLGFDAHALDPLADLNLLDNDYEWVTTCLGGIAAEYCGGRLISVLEGGYDLEVLARSGSAHVRSLMEASSMLAGG